MSVLGLACCSIFHAVEKFYDSWDPVLLWSALWDMDFLVVLLVLGIHAHWSRRVICALGFGSPGVVPSTGMLAGCTSASSPRGHFYRVCSVAHSKLSAVYGAAGVQAGGCYRLALPGAAGWATYLTLRQVGSLCVGGSDWCPGR